MEWFVIFALAVFVTGLVMIVRHAWKAQYSSEKEAPDASRRRAP